MEHVVLTVDNFGVRGREFFPYHVSGQAADIVRERLFPKTQVPILGEVTGTINWTEAITILLSEGWVIVDKIQVYNGPHVRTDSQHFIMRRSTSSKNPLEEEKCTDLAPPPPPLMNQ
jgi:hypothetical protein